MSERVLLLGGGGREHAMARAVAASSVEHELHALASNRNPGIAALADSYTVEDETDPTVVCDVAASKAVTLVLVGPEAPLAAGVTDALADDGIFAFAPDQEHARIETDKAWQRTFMDEHDIPGCPVFATFDDAEAAAKYVLDADGDVAVKPTGLTGGKGVRVTGDQVTKAEAVEYIRTADHDAWVIEERLVGEEFTLQAFVANGSVRCTPAIQDHKRAFEGDEGPNTGGMGSYSDGAPILPFMTRADYDAATDIIEATVDALDDYMGVLYGQFMLTADGPKVVEYNARFGDPEAMNTLPILETDFLDVARAARAGEQLPMLSFADRATVCKYAVPEGYPTDPASGARVTVDEATVQQVNERAAATHDGSDEPPTVQLYYASVDEQGDDIYTTTSRSFAVVGLAASIAAAEAIAAEAMSAAGEGLHIRHDIGTQPLIDQRIAHMRELGR